jgi:hypothetical protein
MEALRRRPRQQRLIESSSESESSTVSQDCSNSSDSSSHSSSNSSMLSTPRAPLLGSSSDDVLPRHHHNKMGPDTLTPPLTPPRSISLTEQSAQDPAEVAEEQILKVIDRLEDEWDEHTYEDIVPLEIKLALEERVFGWSHLVSEFIGYAVFVGGAFLLTYAGLWHVTSRTPWGSWIRGPIAVFAAWTTFRMVRRRRKVWFRAAYGTKAYLEYEPQRRKEVQEADKSSWLGRIRKLQKQRKVARQLRRAETRFSVQHERRLLRTQSLSMAQYSNSIECTTNSCSISKKPRRRLSFRTDPFPVMQSIQQDQITFTDGLIKRMPYSHGGFFGAAPFLLANPHWISILRRLMPDVYVEISRRVKAPLPKLIHWAENNPVVAAYGTAHELEYNGHIPNLEWDIFLDPALVKRVQVVLREQHKFLQAAAPEIANDHSKSPLRASEFYKQSMTQKQRHIMRYYEKELQIRVRTLVDKMLIAHGSLTQLALEQTGFAKHYNYSRVKRTRRTLGGGIYARQWMATYAESLRIGVNHIGDLSPNTSLGVDGSDDNYLTTLDGGVNESSCPNTSLAESLSIVKEIAKIEDPIGLVLDLKSRHVPKEVLGCVVDCLREAGARVEGVGSFQVEDNRDVSQYCAEPVKEILFFHSAGAMQQACHDGRIRDGDTVFFNAGSLLWTPNQMLDRQAILKRAVESCYCSFDPEDAKRSYRLLPFGLTSIPSTTTSYSAADEPVTFKVGSESTIEAYKQRFNLSIGLYVQEFAIDEAAVNLFVQLVNESPHVYDLGLSWGGVNGITLRGMQPHRFTSTDGFWNQRYAGASWDSSLYPPPLQVGID